MKTQMTNIDEVMDQIREYIECQIAHTDKQGKIVNTISIQVHGTDPDLKRGIKTDRDFINTDGKMEQF
jgi:nitrate reductase NapAB chaperone NapD